MTHRVFVYGSLLTGLRYHHVMAGAQRLGEARTCAAFTLLDLGAWPGAVPGEGPLVGELYGVQDAHLEALDRFEEVPTVFARETVTLAGGGEAWIYVLVDPALRRRGVPVAGGCWRSHLLSAGRLG